MRNSVSFICLLSCLACTEVKVSPLYLNQTALSPVTAVISEGGNTSNTAYFYDESGELQSKRYGEHEVSYLVNNNTQQTIIESSEYGRFCYQNNNLKWHNESEFKYSGNNCTEISGKLGAPLYYDTILVDEQAEKIVTLRNTFFGQLKYKTEHTFYKNQAPNKYTIRTSSLYFFSPEINNYRKLESFDSKTIFEIEYHSTQHYLPQPVLEEIFQLRKYLHSGIGYTSIHFHEVILLEGKLPPALPKKISTPTENIEYVYDFDLKGLLSMVKIVTMDKKGMLISTKTIKYNYSNDREGV